MPKWCYDVNWNFQIFIETNVFFQVSQELCILNIYQKKIQESTLRIKYLLDICMITENGNEKIIRSSLTRILHSPRLCTRKELWNTEKMQKFSNGLWKCYTAGKLVFNIQKNKVKTKPPETERIVSNFMRHKIKYNQPHKKFFPKMKIKKN
jgi:hypothetical protein